MAETNHNNKKNVSLGKPKKTGCLYYAPAGTALPTDATTALSATYTCVGYLSEDGVTNATDTDTTDINEMGGIKVLSEISGYGETWQFNMIETNEASLKLRFGTANVTVTADKLTVYHAIPSGESLVLVFEIAMTGNRVKRIVVADGTITEFDDTTYSAGDAIGYGVTMSANPSDLINGATSVEYIANVATASLSMSPPPAPPGGGAHPSERTRIWQPSSRRTTKPRKTSPRPSRPWASPSPSAPRSSTTSTWSNTSTTSKPPSPATVPARSPSSPSSRSSAAPSTRP